MYAVRSNTGRPFIRSGVTFAPKQWKLLESVTPEQIAETQSPLKALLILEDVEINDARFAGFDVDASAIDPELTFGAPVDVATLRAEIESLESALAAAHDAKRQAEEALLTLNQENQALKAQVGDLLPGEHPDEALPRAGTWLAERRNWQAELEQVRAHNAELEPVADRVRALEAELALREKRDALEALTVPALVEKAQAAGVAGAGDLKKAELVAAILGAE